MEAYLRGIVSGITTRDGTIVLNSLAYYQSSATVYRRMIMQACINTDTDFGKEQVDAIGVRQNPPMFGITHCRSHCQVYNFHREATIRSVVKRFIPTI